MNIGGNVEENREKDKKEDTLPTEVPEKKRKRSIFEQLEIQQKRLKLLEQRKKKEIEQVILRSFSFLQQEEIFLKFLAKVQNEDSSFLKNIEEYIQKELEIEEESKK